MKRLLSLVLTGSLLGIGGAAAMPTVARANTVKCPPGAFDDTDGVVRLIDATINKEMSKVEKAFKNLKLAPGASRVVIKTLGSGLVIKTTLARSADGNTLSFELDMAAAATPTDFVVITQGSRTDAGTIGTVHTVNKQVSTDYDALKSFLPNSKPTGHFDATIVHISDTSKPAPRVQDTLSVNFSGITVAPKDPHGPRTGSYTHLGERAIGGWLDFHADVPVPCPGNPAGPMSINVERRHVDDATGERQYRRDAVATGGGLNPGEQQISMNCGTNPVKGSGTLPTRYTLNKREDASGGTIKFTIKLKNETSPNCDPDFGALVSPTDNSTDWGFPHPPSFPGEW